MRYFDCGRTRPRPSSRRAALPALGALVLAAACGGDAGPAGPDPEPEPQVATVEITPGADTLTALGATRSFTAVARDADGDEIPGVSFTWSSSDAGVATVDDEGVVTAAANGTADITATADGVAGSAALAVIQRAETVTVSPASATLTTVGVTQAFTAAATDANGNPVEGAAFLWSSEDPAVATVDSAGVAASKGAGVSTITASVQGVPGHAALTVNQEVDRLAFRTHPSNATAGEAIDPAVQVEVLDAAGHVVADAEIAITLSLGTNPGGGTLGGTKTVHATAGVATFSGLWVDAAAAGYTLAAASTGVTGATSAAFDVAVGPAARVAFVTQPADATAGTALGPLQVEVQDGYGNLVTDGAPEVAVSLAANPGGGTLSGTVSLIASGGVAVFSDLWIDKAASGYQLTAAASLLTGDVSFSFSIGPGAPAQLGFVTQPSRVEGQEPMDTVRVAVQDAYGNTVPTASADVTVRLHSNPTGDALDGTTTAATADGVATFPDLALALPDRGYSLLASADGLDAVESDLFAVTLTFVQLDGGLYHTCGTTVGDHAYCWGENAYGQLGDGTNEGSLTPVPVSTTESFRQLIAGNSHTCGLTLGRQILCWGRNHRGQLGDGTTGDRRIPVAVDVSGLVGRVGFVQISPGGIHTCAVTTEGRLYCWGHNNAGQLGDGTNTSRTTPVAVDVSGLATQSFASVSTGWEHTCGVTTANEAFCWGRNLEGQVGDATTTARTVPTAVSTAESFVVVRAAMWHSCGITDGDSVFCWGANDTGQLGDGTTTDRTTPVAASTAESFAQLDGGRDHTCGLTPAGQPYCWGHNASGQLGDGTTTHRLVPVAVDVSGLRVGTFGRITVGGYHSCGLTIADEAFCWGTGYGGQLGDGTGTGRYTPVRVKQ